MNTNFGLSLASIESTSFEETLKICLEISKKYKLTSFEMPLMGCPYEKYHSLWPWEIKGKYIQIIRRFSENFKFKSFHLPFSDLNPISLNTRIGKESLTQIMMSIDLAKTLEFNFVVMHAKGRRFGANEKQENAYWIMTIKDIAEYAKEKGILLCLENFDYYHDLKDLTDAVKKLSKFNVKVNFDIGHANFPEDNLPLKHYGNIRDFMNAEHAIIHSIHLHDYSRIKGVDHLPVGKGNIDFCELFEELNKYNFQGPINLEYLATKKDELERNIEFIERLI